MYRWVLVLMRILRKRVILWINYVQVTWCWFMGLRRPWGPHVFSRIVTCTSLITMISLWSSHLSHIHPLPLSSCENIYYFCYLLLYSSAFNLLNPRLKPWLSWLSWLSWLPITCLRSLKRELDRQHRLNDMQVFTPANCQKLELQFRPVNNAHVLGSLALSARSHAQQLTPSLASAPSGVKSYSNSGSSSFSTDNTDTNRIQTHSLGDVSTHDNVNIHELQQRQRAVYIYIYIGITLVLIIYIYVCSVCTYVHVCVCGWCRWVVC